MQSIGLAKCCICQGGSSADEPWTALDPCGHVFHQCCVHLALRHAKRCPICREPVKHKLRLFLESKLDTEDANADEVQQALGGLEQENNNLQQQLQNERRTIKDLEHEVSDLLRQLQEKAVQCERLQDKTAKAKSQLEQCRQQSKQQQQQFSEQLAALSGKVSELTGLLQQKQQHTARQQHDIARLQRQLGLSRVCQEPRLSAQQLAEALGPELAGSGEQQQLAAALVRRTEELQAARQSAAQLEQQLAAAGEAARQASAASERRLASLVEGLRQEVAAAKHERNQAEYDRELLRGRLEELQQQQQQQGRQCAVSVARQQDPSEPHGNSAPAEDLWALADDGEPAQLADSFLDAADEAAAGAAAAQQQQQQQQEEAAAMTQFEHIRRPAQLALPLAAPRFAGKSGSAGRYMGVGSFSRGSVLRQGPDGKGGRATALAHPGGGGAKRPAFVSGSGAVKRSKGAKFGAAAGTASIQDFFKQPA